MLISSQIPLSALKETTLVARENILKITSNNLVKIFLSNKKKLKLIT